MENNLLVQITILKKPHHFTFLFLFIMNGEAELYLPSLMARHTMIHSHNHTRS